MPLRSLDSWTVSEGEPDIRGWEIRTVSGRQLGTVNDLLIDPDANEVVMLDVDLPGRQEHTFVPIRIVQIDRVRRLVMMDSADFAAAEGVVADRPPVSVADPATPRTIRYPRYEREVPVDHPITADAAPPSEAMPPDSSLERRRAERRSINRLSTDI
ncbi:MAG TPA: PRC-barrel domain-containing protein [Gemmatimonadaceae bacterium]|nr:PRC-barrel domain-containing protein [Gemmatimonadaceae bacterium]